MAFNPGLQPPQVTRAHLLTSLPIIKPEDEVGSGPPLPLPLPGGDAAGEGGRCGQLVMPATEGKVGVDLWCLLWKGSVC